MKKELKKKIKSICAEIGTAAAAEQIDELTEQVDEEFERCVSSGMSELEAYREILSNVDKIRDMLNALQKTEDEESAAKEKKYAEENSKRVNAILGSIETCMWLLTVAAYIIGSFMFGYWHLTWLIFLFSSIGSIILGMVKKYNKGEPLGRVMDKGFSGIMWLAIIIVYFFVSFTFGGWAYTWIIFLLGSAVESIRSGIRKAKH